MVSTYRQQIKRQMCLVQNEAHRDCSFPLLSFVVSFFGLHLWAAKRQKNIVTAAFNMNFKKPQYQCDFSMAVKQKDEQY